MAFIEGYAMGFAMVIFIGPVFFTLLKSSLQYGFWGGMMVTGGIFVSDMAWVVLCSFGAIPFFKNPGNQIWLGILGGILLFALGIKYVFKPVLYSDENISLQSRHYTALFAKGFLVNFVSPFVFLVWISVIGYGRTKFGVSADLALFLCAVLLGILTTDSLKVIFSHRIKALLQPGLLLNIYRIIGLVLIVSGVRMIWYVM
ncbi:MAG TPA: LysE family transporter [Chitinophagales bacterium]|nr:LysE family transporter [Chitinophagales bacterium]